jgi:hypothetical protein
MNCLKACLPSWRSLGEAGRFRDLTADTELGWMAKIRN